MKILAIDTSCDDTCLSIIKVKSRKSSPEKFEVLVNLVSSQIKIHQKWGGVYPNLAKREHQKNLPIVLKKGLKRIDYSVFKIPKIDLIAVTIGPGLEPCLWQGVNFAKSLSNLWKKSIIPINHIEGHIFANWLPLINSSSKIKKIIFPAICLIVSGGHTQLILMKEIGKYKLIGETRDDAGGECFDKTARILGLPYPGGPALAEKAAEFKKENLKFKIRLPRPMLFQKNYDFSFSGLKTAVLYHFKEQPKKIRKSKKYIKAMAFEIQQAVIDVLIGKTLRAVKEYKTKTLILGGGVIANKELRKQFREKIKKEIPNLNCLIPPFKYCTDNAAMIGATAYYRSLKGRTKDTKEIKVEVNLRIEKE